MLQSCLALGEGTHSEPQTARTINWCPRGRGWDGSSRTRALGSGPHGGPCASFSFPWTRKHQCVPYCSLPNARVTALLLPRGPSDAYGEDNSPLGLITECKELHLSLNFHSVVNIQTTILMLRIVTS